MTAELWLHRPCVHGHEGSWRTHPPVAAMLSGDESPCEGGRPRVRLDPEREVMFLASNESGEVWYLAPIREIIDALEEE